MRWAFQLSSFQKLVTKPIAIARNLDDADYLAQIEAVDRFTDNMIAYPGRTFGQLYHRLLKGNALVDGTFERRRPHALGRRHHRCRCWSSRAAADGIAPVASVKASVPLLTGAREVRFEIVPGGHLGMLTGAEGAHQHLARARRVDRPVVRAGGAARTRPSYQGEEGHEEGRPTPAGRDQPPEDDQEDGHEEGPHPKGDGEEGHPEAGARRRGCGDRHQPHASLRVGRFARARRPLTEIRWAGLS